MDPVPPVKVDNLSMDALPGLLLAGGQSQRMGLVDGGDKCLMMLGGRPVLDRVIERAAPQVQRLVLNANGGSGRFASFGLPIIADRVGVGLGPLAGVQAGLEWTAQRLPRASHMVSFPTDTPFLPLDLVSRLVVEIERGAELACARVANRLQPLFAIWPVALRRALRRALVEEGQRKVDGWMARYRLAVVDFPVDRVNWFFNINDPSDLEDAELLLHETDFRGPSPGGCKAG